jgi:glycosyltransferase involved in cell wall biosynthesis
MHQRRADSRPYVSVVMPVRDEADFVAESLGAVLAQDYPHERLEVLVADGLSRDGTREIVRQLAAAAPDVPVTLVDNPGRIVPTGLNLALQRACGDIIVRVDGHCRIAPDYVSRCVDHLRRSKVDGVGGPIRTIARTRVGQAIASAMSSRFGVGSSMFRTVTDRTLLVDTIAFPAYTRAALDLAGPFDETLVRNQDDEYNYRLRKLGARLLLAADVRSDYYSRSTLRSLCRQYFQYGFYKVRVMQKHPRQMSARQFAPPLFVSGLLLAPVAAAVSPLAGDAAVTVVALYALATLGVSAAIARRNGWAQAPALVAAFPALHLSYGLGFLAGCGRLIGAAVSSSGANARGGAASVTGA